MVEKIPPPQSICGGHGKASDTLAGGAAAQGSPHIRARCAALATHDPVPVVRPGCGRAAGREPAVVSKEVLIIILHFPLVSLRCVYT